MDMRSATVTDLSGPALDWAVAAAAEGLADNTAVVNTLEGPQVALMLGGEPVGIIGSFPWHQRKRIAASFERVGLSDFYSPSTSWQLGGQLVDKFDLWIRGPIDDSPNHTASVGPGTEREGRTKLEAAMRAIVAHLSGEVVKVPAVLLERCR